MKIENVVKRISIPTPGLHPNRSSEISLTEAKRTERRLDHGVAAGEDTAIRWRWGEVLLPAMAIPVFAFGKPSGAEVTVFHAGWELTQAFSLNLPAALVDM